jgi:hypothetical protein
MPPIHSQLDLHRQWRALMGELGFTGTSLWCLVLDPDGQVTGQLAQIGELPDLPDPQLMANLMQMFADVLAEVGAGASVAFLRSRPGRATLSRADRAWATRLIQAARAADVQTWPVHLACDDKLVVISPDDLIEADPA